jgi:acyl carrier protein
MEDELRAFLADIFFLGDDPASLPGSRSLIGSGIIDSTGVLELVQFLEGTWGFSVRDEEMVPDNLDSLAKLESFVGKKLGK